MGRRQNLTLTPAGYRKSRSTHALQLLSGKGFMRAAANLCVGTLGRVNPSSEVGDMSDVAAS